MASVIVSRVTAVLNIPTKNADLIIMARAIQSSMTGNASFGGLQPKVQQLQNDIYALETAETGLMKKPPACTAATRDVATETVKNTLRSLRNDVQNVADQHGATAEAVILSASMNVKTGSNPGKRQNTATELDEMGVIALTGEGKGAHQWQMSYDVGATLINLDPTLGGVTKVSGIAPGVTVVFRNRLILTKGQYGDWSDWIYLTTRTVK